MAGNLSQIIEKMSAVTVLVAGDVMLDTFVYGDTKRISPEGPVPVLTIEREVQMLGGAGNVVSNLAGLKIRQPLLLTVVGGDEPATRVREIAKKLGADPEGILADSSRPTTLKTRYLARGQQLLRTDFEKTSALDERTEKTFLQQAEKFIAKADALILSDYGKGVLTPRVIEKLIGFANKKGIPSLVDPKAHDYSVYKGADVVTPNKQELSAATGGMSTGSSDDVVLAAEALMQKSGIAAVVATRSQDGMTIVRGGGQKPVHLKAQAREVFDVSGAGDTVIAVIAAAMAAGADLVEAASLANAAGGIVVGKVGTAPIRAEELLDVPAAQSSCLYSVEQALEQVERWRLRGLKTGFTNGCFDILHAGHVAYLNEARQQCDRLVIGLNTDASVGLLKGAGRPLHDAQSRAAVLGSLSAVDMIVLFGAEKEEQDNTARSLLEMLKPEKYFKGGDYKIETLPEAKMVQSYGGAVVIIPFQEGHSTSATIKRIKSEKAA